MRRLAGAANLLVEQVRRQRMGREVGAPARSAPLPGIGGVAEVKPPRMLQATVEVLEAGNGLGNQIADTVVVGDQRVPVHRAVAQGGLGDAGDDRRLRTHLGGRGLKLATGGVDHAEGVFHRHRLRSFELAVDIGTPQARQDQCVPADHEVAAIELGADLHRQRAIAQRGVGAMAVRRGLGEVAAKADEDLGLALEHRVDGFHGVVTVLPRHLESEAPFQRIQQRRWRPVVDAHGAVALHVAVTAHRTETGAGAADVAAQQLQVDDFLDGRHRMAVLGDAHGPADDHLPGVAVDARGGLDFLQGQARLLLNLRPGRSVHCGEVGVDALGMLGDERVVEHRRLAVRLGLAFPLQ
ncbi:hypothetical protein D9M71_386040 [compost metagenome]